MPAYVIIMREGPIQDQEALAEYMRRAMESPFNPKMKILAFYGASETTHGNAPDGVVIMEFPTMANAREWYDSPHYREARRFRHKAAPNRDIFVEGFVPPTA